MKRKKLERLIAQIPDYENPKIEYEQYTIPPALAADIVWIAETKYRDISGKLVIDLGCGTGRLTVAAALMGARQVIGIDLDYEAVNQAKNSLTQLFLKLSNIDLVCADAFMPPIARPCDTVVENPPFGVHKKGYDVSMLKAAAEMGGVIYTIHKSSTANYIENFIKKQLRKNLELIYTAKIPIPPIYPFHAKPRHEVEVHIYRVT